MASLSKGYTFGATETVTNAKLHTLVDSGTVTGIVNADVAALAGIDEDKLAPDGTYFVALTGAQTVAGVKTFSSFPLTPESAPTSNYQVANKKYIDDNLITNLIIPVVTEDPAAPSTGQIWFRSDLA